MAFSAFTTQASVLTQTVGGASIEKSYTVSAGHTFAHGEAVYLNSSGEVVKARADSISTSYTIGVIKAVEATAVTVGYQGDFTVDSGLTGYFPLVTGNVYYLSPTIDGGITSSSPTNSSLVVQPLLVAKDSYSGIIINSIPKTNYGFTSIYTPVGTMVPYAGKADNVPTNWLLCAGDALAKGTTTTDTYNNLYAVLGNKYSVHGVARSGSTGTYAYIKFDGDVEDAPTYGSGLPGSTKNHSLVNGDVYKLVWGTKEAVVSVSTSSGLTPDVTFQFVAGITGATNAFTGLVEATEVTLKSLVNGEAAGYTSDKFFLPDLRGRMAIGAGRGVGLTYRYRGTIGGEENHTLTTSELPSHRHSISLRNSDSISGSAQYVIGGTGASVNAVLSTDLLPNSGVTDLTGGGEDHENMSPYIVTNWIIRYQTNAGQPGIEVGPKGDAGAQGVQGATGATGARGTTGTTGYSVGTVSYRYTPISTPPNGYWTESSGYLTVSSLEDSNVNISSYVETWDNSTSSSKGIVFIRDVYNSPAFFRIYTVTGTATTGNAGGYTYYRFPVSTVVASGTGSSGNAYNFMFVPYASDGTNGVNGTTGDTGVKGETGAKGETGPQGATGIPGTCSCPTFISPQDATIYIDPSSSNTTATISYLPYSFSAVSTEPTSFSYFKSSLFTPAKYGYDETAEIRLPQPIPLTEIIKYNFNYSATGATPCDGECIGATGYYNFCDAVRIAGSSVPPTQMNLVLSPNKTYTFEHPVVIRDCNFSIYADSGSVFTKTPTGLSANYHDTTAGSTGREFLNIDVYGDTNNVTVGNYLVIKPEHFGLTSAASATGYQSLCGVYRINEVDYTNDRMRLQGRIPGGISGASTFTGSLSYPQISSVDIYTTIVEFKNNNGFIVEPTGTLMMGRASNPTVTSEPFVVIHTGSLTGSEASKGLISTGGKSFLGSGMSFFSWPKYGSALYANNAGSIRGERIIGSNNGTFVYAEMGSKVNLREPTTTRNNVVMISDNASIVIDGATGGATGASGGAANRRYLSANNSTTAMIINSGNISIKDVKPQIITSINQLGFMLNRSSLTIQGLSGNDGALIGPTGIALVRGMSLNNGSVATVELDTITIRSSVTGNSIFGATKRTGTINSVYTAPIVAGSNFGGDKLGLLNDTPPFEEEQQAL